MKSKKSTKKMVILQKKQLSKIKGGNNRHTSAQTAVRNAAP